MTDHLCSVLKATVSNVGYWAHENAMTCILETLMGVVNDSVQF